MYQALIRNLFASAVLIFMLGGCATVQYHDWHKGETNTGAVLTSIETVLIESINGRETDSAFIGQTHSYELPPGDYAVVVTYADLFDKTADDFEKVKSNPVKLEFSVDKGVKYRLEHREIKGLVDAEKFAEKPVINLINVQTGKVLVAKVEYTTPRSILSRLKFESEKEQVFASEYLRDNAERKTTSLKASSSADSSSLKMLKFSWQEATPADRAAFLKWLNDK